MKMIFAALAALCVLTHGSAALAQEKGAVRPGFTSAVLQGQKIVLFRPSVWVGEQSTAGMPEPNADWTAQSRALIAAELSRFQGEFRNEILPEPELVGSDAELVSSHRALFGSVAKAVQNYQFFSGNRLPTRKNKPFEWSLGSGTGRIAELTGARYGLFIFTHDAYGSTGRKVLQFLAAGLAGVSVKSGEHLGYAGLVDLSTGDLLWLNADLEMGGDVRTGDGMRKRVAQLLEDFPGLRPQPARP